MDYGPEDLRRRRKQDAALKQRALIRGRGCELIEALLAPDEEWLSTHHWVWSRARLQEAFKEHSEPVFICGIARNIRDVVDLFDCVLLLRIDADTQEERLRAYDGSNPSLARNEAGRQQIRVGRPFFEAEMLELGAIPVDAKASTTAVADAMLQLVSRYIPGNRDAAGN